MVVNPKGEFIKSYKKSFLFETDETWASPGPGFDTITIENKQGQKVKLGHGICMDINPEKF